MDHYSRAIWRGIGLTGLHAGLSIAWWHLGYPILQGGFAGLALVAGVATLVLVHADRRRRA